MKTLIKQITLIIIATNVTACGLVDKSEPEDEEAEVVIVSDDLEEEEESQFTGVYQGTTTTVMKFTVADESADDSDIQESRVTITESRSGDLLIDGLIEGCIFQGTNHGDWIEIGSECVDEGRDVRATYYLSGEGEFSKSGKLLLDVHGDISVDEKVHYSHGAEWEQAVSGDVTIDFSGRAM